MQSSIANLSPQIKSYWLKLPHRSIIRIYAQCLNVNSFKRTMKKYLSPDIAIQGTHKIFHAGKVVKMLSNWYNTSPNQVEQTPLWPAFDLLGHPTWVSAPPASCALLLTTSHRSACTKTAHLQSIPTFKMQPRFRIVLFFAVYLLHSTAKDNLWFWQLARVSP